jgi:8-oxo-dGTP diphosphatase
VTIEETGALPRWTRVAAHALAIDGGGRILPARVAEGYLAPGMWTLAGGGLDFGEPPADAVLRELTEETGLSGQVQSLAFVDSTTNGPLVEAGRTYGPWHGVRIIYRVDIIGGELRGELDESTDAAAWFSRPEIDSLPRTDLVDVALHHLDAH